MGIKTQSLTKMTDNTLSILLSLVIGSVCALYALQGVYYGQIRARFTDYSRYDQPKTFWLIVGFFCALAAFFFSGALVPWLDHLL